MDYQEPTLDLLTYEQVWQLFVDGPRDKFTDQEIGLRVAVHDFLKRDPLISRILFTDPINDPFHTADALVLSGGCWVWLEGKERGSRLQDRETWLIDEAKIEALQDLARKTQMEAAWVNLTSDRHCLLWPINAKATKATKTCPASTFDKSRGKRRKSVLLYPTNTAHELR